MLDCLKPIKDIKWDCLSFFEDPDNEEKLNINGSRFEEPGEYEVGNNQVQIYHVVLVKDHDEDPALWQHFDHFEAGLMDPLEYVSGLIPQGWFGFVAKKSTNSHKFVHDTIDKMKEFL